MFQLPHVPRGLTLPLFLSDPHYCNMDDPVHTLPYDILTRIADQSAALLDSATLLALSQTCKLMVPVCRRHLFTSIWLDGKTERKYENLMKLLQEKIEIASYVRILSCKLEVFRNKYQEPILEALLKYSVSRGHSSSLQNINLFSGVESGWDEQTESTKYLLISLIQLPTIKGLYFSSVKDFPINQLSLCSGLRSLSLQYIDGFSLDNVTCFPVGQCRIPTPLQLDVTGMSSFNSLAILMDSDKGPNELQPIIDFSLLQETVLSIDQSAEVDHICKLLKAAQQLQQLEICGESLAYVYICKCEILIKNSARSR